MARDDINNIISENTPRKPKSSSNEKNHQLNLEIKAKKELHKLELQQKKELAAFELQLAMANIKAEGKQREKQLKNLNKTLAKYSETQNLRTSTEQHNQAYETNKDYIKAKQENRQAIVNDPNASLKEKAAAWNGFVGQEMKDGLVKGINNLVQSLDKLNSRIDTYSEYQSAVNARVQGSNKRFEDMQKNLTKAIGLSPFIKNEDLMKNLTELVDLGIVYNIEQRAFLQTISDEIATTFDAHNESMLRLVRLQQADSTAARLGLEANLTAYLNKTFENSEYLTKSFDDVTAALLETSSQLNYEQAVQLEYTVQKWLGSLSSVGLSSSTINNLASAIGYLGAGDIDKLAGSDGMQNLIVMAANRSGLDYSQLLTDQGYYVANINTLLANVVEYMQVLASNSDDNAVVRSKYASTFGLAISDLTAALNIRDSIDSIYEQTLDYEGSLTELNYQFGEISKRMGTAGMIDTLLDNLTYNLAAGVADDPVSSAIWKINDLIESVTGGINVPTVGVMGTYVDLEANLNQIVKLGIVGANALGMIGEALAGLGDGSTGNGKMTKAFEILSSEPISKKTTSRGSGLSYRVFDTTSASAYVGNSSGEDIFSQLMNDVDNKRKSDLAENQKDAGASTDDIHKYLINTLSDKLDLMTDKLITLTTLYAASTIAKNDNVWIAANGFTDSVAGNLILALGEASVSVTAPDVDTTEVIQTIESNVAGIKSLLESVITGNNAIRTVDTTWGNSGGNSQILGTSL